MTNTRLHDRQPAMTDDKAQLSEGLLPAIDLGLIDSMTDQFLAYPMPLVNPYFYPETISVYKSFIDRAGATRPRTHRAPSHRLRDLEMLANCADNLRQTIGSMHATDRLLLSKRLPLPGPARLTALRTADGIIAFLALLAQNARAQFCDLGGQETPRSTPSRQPGIRANSSIDIESRLSDVAARYFGRPDLWSRLADVALHCGSYRADVTESPAFSESYKTITQTAQMAERLMGHLLKFRFRERVDLFTFDCVSNPLSGTDREPLIDHPHGDVRRLRAMCRMLLAIAEHGTFTIVLDTVGLTRGRRDISDAAVFAVTCCASLWVAFTELPLGGRLAKTGTFSRFVEEFLSEAAPLFPPSQLSTALRGFHDHRDQEIGQIAAKFGKNPTLFLPKRPPARSREFS